ncbi:CNNM domain-containing protein [Echinimonas agarilytica]|uniref:Hemolysin family protein n=1 Tax=Echinimonas agarilytica TaxID=1215918 RepID=A0AA41W715_9GAMM|nr:hemolysin family protein [Echinimonas agarilytica]MCM2680262.1 hemolysin family protein [Echinimonas agarilytica]
MSLLILFVVLAVAVSFLCSIFEAVLLSVTTPHIALLEKEEKRSGTLLRKFKDNINNPLAAILTLNTIAHTIGAAGAGAQATHVFGDAYIGVFSAVLTFLILVFSEIIPKTLGAQYWRQLAGITSLCLHYMIIAMYPFIKMADFITRMMGTKIDRKGLTRNEFVVMAEVSEQEGQLAEHEARILQSVMRFKDTKVREVMTPRVVVYSANEHLTVEAYLQGQPKTQYSRIPVYSDDKESVTGFVMRSDLLLAHANGDGHRELADFKRELFAVLDNTPLFNAFDLIIEKRSHILLIVDEYGQMVGVLTQEDLVETLLGLEIMDESDKSADLQLVAKRYSKRRAKRLEMAAMTSSEEQSNK